ncbi:MAG: histidine phosphatase family protein, partial [Planctomycetota bacterium]|nr:histidine phosphatase family protein [Planctomycetota bacterium]
MALRVLHFIRHGQYHVHRHHPEHGHLTDIGRQQAQTLGATYKDFPASVLHVSTLPRAMQTAEPITDAIPEAARRNSHLLREMIPAATREHVRSMRAFREFRTNEILAMLTLEPELRRAVDADFSDLAGLPVERERGYKLANKLYRPPR